MMPFLVMATVMLHREGSGHGLDRGDVAIDAISGNGDSGGRSRARQRGTFPLTPFLATETATLHREGKSRGSGQQGTLSSTPFLAMSMLLRREGKSQGVRGRCHRRHFWRR